MAREIAQSVKMLACEHVDLNLTLKIHIKKAGCGGMHLLEWRVCTTTLGWSAILKIVSLVAQGTCCWTGLLCSGISH